MVLISLVHIPRFWIGSDEILLLFHVCLLGCYKCLSIHVAGCWIEEWRILWLIQQILQLNIGCLSCFLVGPSVIMQFIFQLAHVVHSHWKHKPTEKKWGIRIYKLVSKTTLCWMIMTSFMLLNPFMQMSLCKLQSCIISFT